LSDYALLMQDLETRGLFTRSLEALPSDGDLQERARSGRGLTRPELAVLLSYAKIAVQHELLASRLPDERKLEPWLTSYFPEALRARFPNGIVSHSLRREIIALGITNALVNRGGPAMAVRLGSETRRPVADIAHAFVVVRAVFDLPALWQRIDALDGKVPGEAQLRLYQATRELVNAQTQWFLHARNGKADLAATIEMHKAGLAALAGSLEAVLPPRRKADMAQRTSQFAEGGVPADLAEDVARLGVLSEAPAITEIAAASGKPVSETGRVYLEIGEHLHIAELGAAGASIASADKYDRLAIAQALSQIASARASFARAAIKAGSVEAWRAAQGERLSRMQPALDEAAAQGALRLSQLLVVSGQLSELASLQGGPSASPTRARRKDRAPRAASGSRPARKRASPSRS
jgi:glutamate dehydrogenase